jgi:toxin-antitoxin system PIN domain toxin
MIIVDANLLLYAENSSSQLHDKARLWWDEQLSGKFPVYLSWTVLNAFLSISTNKRVIKNPLTMKKASNRIQSWLDQPCTRLVNPTNNHWTLFKQILLECNIKGRLVMDAHLAALAMEHGCTLYSTDSDFALFPKLKWNNPLI